MNYKILKHNDGRMLAVVWPEDCEPLNLGISLCLLTKSCKCAEAIANGIPFKEKKDIERLEIICFAIDQKYKDIDFIINFGILYPHTREKFQKWSMPTMKPYDLSEGTNVVTMEIDGEMFAFIEPERAKKFREKYQKQQPERKEESQQELWDDLEGLLFSDNDMKVLISNNTKSKFRIERIK